jgi:hypothetical protein
MLFFLLHSLLVGHSSQSPSAGFLLWQTQHTTYNTRNFKWTKEREKQKLYQMGKLAKKERKIHERIFLSTRDFSLLLLHRQRNNNKKTYPESKCLARPIGSIVLVSCYGFLRFYLFLLSCSSSRVSVFFSHFCCSSGLCF